MELDQESPDPPTISPQLDVAGGLLMNGAILVTGMAIGEAGGTVTVQWTNGIGVGETREAVVQPNGYWEVMLQPGDLPPALLVDGLEVFIKAYVTDVAGNSGWYAESARIPMSIGDETPNSLVGSWNGDYIFGGGGNDTISGLDGNDAILGGEGDDTIDGGVGDDYIDGGEGDDYISGGVGSDRVTGGPGADTFRFRQGDSGMVVYFSDSGQYLLSLPDVITDFGINDTLELVDGSGAATLQGDEYFSGTVGDQKYAIVLGTWDGLFFTENQSGDDVLVIYDGDSSLGVMQTGIVLEGAAATLGLSPGSLMYLGSSGNDDLNYGGEWRPPSVIIGGAGNDNLTGGGGNDILYGGAGNDILGGGEYDDKIYGGPGVDDVNDFWGGVDEFFFYQGDTPAFSSTGYSGTVNVTADASDTFSFEGIGQDTIRGLGHNGGVGDKIWLLDDEGGYLTHQAFDFMQEFDFGMGDTITLNDQSYLVLGGTWNGGEGPIDWSVSNNVSWDGEQSFTVGSGSDTLIIYDADADPDVVQAAAIVVIGTNVNNFHLDDGYLTYLP